MLKAVFFDLDETLIDGNPCHLEAGVRAFSEWNMDYAAARKLTGSFSGIRMSEILAVRRDALGLNEQDVPIDALMAARVHHYLHLIPSHVQLMPSARAAMEAAKGFGAVLLVVSSEVTLCIQAVLRQFDLEDLVTCVVGGDDVERGKPAPDCYELAFARLQALCGAAKEECLAVEDSRAGGAAALAAGLRLCLVPSPYEPIVNGLTPHYRLASLAEFPALVQALAAR